MRTRVALVVLFIGTSGATAAHEPTLSRFTFGEHARPIFLEHCGGCHRAGGVAPMSLLDYQEAVPWANAIKLALLESRMPPFLPGDEGGPFRDARSLTAKELDILVDWAGGATPEGESPATGDSRYPGAISRAGSRASAGGGHSRRRLFGNDGLSRAWNRAFHSTGGGRSRGVAGHPIHSPPGNDTGR